MVDQRRENNKERLLAVDLVLLFDQESEQKIIKLSNTLKDSSYILSDQRKPHISLCKFLIKEKDIDKIEIFSKNFILSVDSLLEHQEKEGRTTCLFLKENYELLNFQKKVVSEISSFFQSEDVHGSFFTEEVNELTKFWTLSALKNRGKYFNPHISLGFGTLRVDDVSFELKISRIALVQMGNYCSCSKLLRLF